MSSKKVGARSRSEFKGVKQFSLIYWRSLQINNFASSTDERQYQNLINWNTQLNVFGKLYIKISENSMDHKPSEE